MLSSPELHKLIEQEVEVYREDLPPPDSDWPMDVRTVMRHIHEHLFEEGLRIQDVMQRCGTYDHNSSSRFAYYVGQPPKAYTIKHRLRLARRLLRHEALQSVRLIRIALAVGYGSESAFAMTFKEREGCTPKEYRTHRSRRN